MLTTASLAVVGVVNAPMVPMVLAVPTRFTSPEADEPMSVVARRMPPAFCAMATPDRLVSRTLNETVAPSSVPPDAIEIPGVTFAALRLTAPAAMASEPVVTTEPVTVSTASTAPAVIAAADALTAPAILTVLLAEFSVKVPGVTVMSPIRAMVFSALLSVRSVPLLAVSVPMFSTLVAPWVTPPLVRRSSVLLKLSVPMELKLMALAVVVPATAPNRNVSEATAAANTSLSTVSVRLEFGAISMTEPAVPWPVSVLPELPRLMLSTETDSRPVVSSVAAVASVPSVNALLLVTVTAAVVPVAVPNRPVRVRSMALVNETGAVVPVLKMPLAVAMALPDWFRSIVPPKPGVLVSVVAVMLPPVCFTSPVAPRSTMPLTLLTLTAPLSVMPPATDFS